MKKVFIVLVCIILAGKLASQNIIGLSKDQVMETMKKSYTDFTLDNSTKNETYKYLKYVDKFNDQTLLIFLSANDLSTSTKLMSDYSNLKDVRAKLSKNYKPKGKDSWTYTINGAVYQVVLKKEEWYFTVFTSKKEK